MAQAWTGPLEDFPDDEVGEVSWDGGNGIRATIVGDFYSPVWRRGTTLYLMGHHKYADDDLEIFDVEPEQWGPELLAAVGNIVVTTEPESSTKAGILEIPTGVLALIDCFGSDAPSSAEVKRVQSSRGAVSHKSKSFTLLAVDPGRYEVWFEELGTVDQEFGTFSERLRLEKLHQ